MHHQASSVCCILYVSCVWGGAHQSQTTGLTCDLGSDGWPPLTPDNMLCWAVSVMKNSCRRVNTIDKQARCKPFEKMNLSLYLYVCILLFDINERFNDHCYSIAKAIYIYIYNINYNSKVEHIQHLNHMYTFAYCKVKS